MRPNGSFSDRLRRVMREGNLTGADLARWFGRPDPTVRGWINDERQFRGAALDQAYVKAQLAKLEKLLGRKQGLPVPRMTLAKRIAYLEGLRDTP